MKENKNEIVWLDNSIWATKHFLTNLESLDNEMEKQLIDKYPMSKNENTNNLKWAFIETSKGREMCWVDNETMRAYEADGYNQTDKEIKDFTFEHWCTSFDL